MNIIPAVKLIRVTHDKVPYHRHIGKRYTYYVYEYSRLAAAYQNARYYVVAHHRYWATLDQIGDARSLADATRLIENCERGKL